MLEPSRYKLRCCWPRFLGLAVCWGLLLASSPGLAADIVRVEEQWELTVATPDPGSDAPQATCLISPVGGISGLHAAFELNQRSIPYFRPGGLQLQVWLGETPLAQVEAANTAVLSQADEKISWTQSMEVSGGVLKFAVTGQSSTWGDFGQADELKIQVPTTLANLNEYDPAVSAQNSAVGYAANRVKSLVLKRVRYLAATGETWEDSTNRLVHSLPQ